MNTNINNRISKLNDNIHIWRIIIFINYQCLRKFKSLLKSFFYLQNRNKERPKAINMNLIMYAIHKGRIDATKTITIKVLHDAGVFSTAKYGIKLVGRV